MTTSEVAEQRQQQSRAGSETGAEYKATIKMKCRVCSLNAYWNESLKKLGEKKRFAVRELKI